MVEFQLLSFFSAKFTSCEIFENNFVVLLCTARSQRSNRRVCVASNTCNKHCICSTKWNKLHFFAEKNHECRTKGPHMCGVLKCAHCLGLMRLHFFLFLRACIALSPVHCVPSMLSTLCTGPLVLIDVVSSQDSQSSVSPWDT